jgi:predicted metal-binding protein
MKILLVLAAFFEGVFCGVCRCLLRMFEEVRETFIADGFTLFNVECDAKCSAYLKICLTEHTRLSMLWFWVSSDSDAFK